MTTPNADSVRQADDHEHLWSDWVVGMVAEHRYCRCGEAESRPLQQNDRSGAQ